MGPPPWTGIDRQTGTDRGKPMDRNRQILDRKLADCEESYHGLHQEYLRLAGELRLKVRECNALRVELQSLREQREGVNRASVHGRCPVCQRGPWVLG